MNAKDAQALALAFAVAVRTAAYYERDNAVMQQTTTLLRSLLAECSEENGSIMIGVHSHCVFVGTVRIRSTVSTYPRFAYLIDLYDSWEIDGLTFFSGLSEAELMTLLTILARDKDRGLDQLTGRLQDAGVTSVEVDLVGGGGTRPAVIAPVEAYAACIQMSEQLAEGAAEEEATNVRQLRHVTQAAVDQILNDPPSLVALTTIRDFDHYLIYHSTNVAILSVVLGQRLGLSKSRLGELCLAAFLHDSGKLAVQPGVLHKPGVLDAHEWTEMRRHPSLAASALLGDTKLTSSSMRAVVVAFEHHLHYDMSGYPKTKLKHSVSLFGNIVSIADVYDAMTTSRAYRSRNFTPHETIGFIVKKAGTLFDPMLVKLFVEIMGLYPDGTVVELTTGEIAVVCEPPAVGLPLDRPKVRVLHGGEVGAVLDLNHREGGAYVSGVKYVVNPSGKGMLPAVAADLFDLGAVGGAALGPEASSGETDAA